MKYYEIHTKFVFVFLSRLVFKPHSHGAIAIAIIFASQSQ